MVKHLEVTNCEERQKLVTQVSSSSDKREYYREYYRKNKIKRLAQSVEWGRKNKEKKKVIKDRWRAKNKERTNFLTRRYNYRKKNAKGSVSFEEVKLLYKKLPACPYCNRNRSDTVDHVTPLSRGGTNDLSNLLAVCRSCNSKKSNKTLFEWDPMLVVQFNSISRSKHFNA